LHRKFSIDLSRHETTALAQKTLPDYFTYTKEFEVAINEFKQSERHSGIYYSIDLNEGYSAFVVRALKAMPNLRSLRFVFSRQFLQAQLIIASDGSTQLSAKTTTHV
jgi:hypothetical protein